MNINDKIERVMLEVRNIVSHDDAPVSEVEAAIKVLQIHLKIQLKATIERRLGTLVQRARAYVARLANAFLGK